MSADYSKRRVRAAFEEAAASAFVLSVGERDEKQREALMWAHGVFRLWDQPSIGADDLVAARNILWAAQGVAR